MSQSQVVETQKFLVDRETFSVEVRLTDAQWWAVWEAIKTTEVPESALRNHSIVLTESVEAQIVDALRRLRDSLGLDDRGGRATCTRTINTIQCAVSNAWVAAEAAARRAYDRDLEKIQSLREFAAAPVEVEFDLKIETSGSGRYLQWSVGDSRSYRIDPRFEIDADGVPFTSFDVDVPESTDDGWKVGVVTCSAENLRSSLAPYAEVVYVTMQRQANEQQQRVAAWLDFIDAQVAA